MVYVLLFRGYKRFGWCEKSTSTRTRDRLLFTYVDIAMDGPKTTMRRYRYVPCSSFANTSSRVVTNISFVGWVAVGYETTRFISSK